MKRAPTPTPTNAPCDAAVREEGHCESSRRFATIAGNALRASIALVFTLDRDSCDVIGGAGLPASWRPKRDGVLRRVLCEPLALSDTASSAPWGDGDPFADLGARAVAGAPVRMADGATVAALCVLDQAPRAWTADDVEMLRLLAASMAAEIELRRTARALAQRDATSQSIFRDAALGMLITDSGGRILSVNAKFASMLGYRAEDLVGVDLTTLKHPADAVRDTALRAELLAGKRDVVETETRYRTRSGDWIWTRLRGSIARDQNGDVTFTIGTLENIERERHIEHALRVSEERYRALVHNLPNTSVILFDHDLRFLVADGEALLNAVGVSREEMEGRTLAEVVLPENLAVLTDVYRATLEGREECVEVSRNGRILSMHTSARARKRFVMRSIASART